jgi:hypothetical protein
VTCPFEPIILQSCLSELGTGPALKSDVGIDVCGRESNASPMIGAVFLVIQWIRDDLAELANALMTDI